MIVDSFMFNNELDMLECRLVEIADAVDHVIAVEADVDHQDHPKPFVLSENLDRFAEWKDKLVVVRATGLPSAKDYPDPWARELAQREHVRTGFEQIGGVPSDCLVLHGDIDEIPTRTAINVARTPTARGFCGSKQRGHFFAVDWLYPHPWLGTVYGRAKDIGSFADMRTLRTLLPSHRYIPGGWHLSWLGGDEANLAKLGSFCHPEVEDRIHAGLQAGNTFLNGGVHVDGEQMTPVDVDKSWPRYVFERRCPENWFRPRG